MWISFVKHYFDTNDDKVVEELNKKYAKYALVCFFGLLKFVEPGTEIQDAVDANFDKVFN